MPVNLQRRKVVMARSMKLGHCVCNPRQGCPCDVFKEHNVCPCAGEKLPVRAGQVLLTRHVQKAGCASKIGQADLRRLLSNLPPITDPNVVVGMAAGDDAGVYRISPELSLVQTVDVFTPCVDDPHLFGQIAAANSLSDIYAMGGRPLTALSIIGFPIDDLDSQIIQQILQGGIEKLNEAGCSLIGGHSIIDQEIKCGFAVTGLIDSQPAVMRDNARPGDLLVLTKPLGTGMVCFAAQIGRATQECIQEAGAAMATLNKDASELMRQFGARACTDITGFGLMGHLVEMARNSGVSVELDMLALPVFAAVRECLDQEVLPGAIERNQEYAMAWARVADEACEPDLPIVYDPQTSGGLLISIPKDAARQLVEQLRSRGHTAASVIGRVIEKPKDRPEGEVIIRGGRLSNFIRSKPGIISFKPESTLVEMNTPESQNMTERMEITNCCSEDKGAGNTSAPPATQSSEGGVAVSSPSAESLFADFLKRTSQEGNIDKRAKKLISIALSVAQRCKPCLENHIKSARALGISQAEIDEAAWMGIAFAGSPAMVFYREVSAQLKG